jgi:hypothetical protein
MDDVQNFNSYINISSTEIVRTASCLLNVVLQHICRIWLHRSVRYKCKCGITTGTVLEYFGQMDAHSWYRREQHNILHDVDG